MSRDTQNPAAKLIIAGSRTVPSEQAYLAIESYLANPPFMIGSIVSGHCAPRWRGGTEYGVDHVGERWAKNNRIPVELFPADWNRLGKGAGFARNQQMAESSTQLLAVWDGHSSGTLHMMGAMKQAGKPVVVLMVLDPQ